MDAKLTLSLDEDIIRQAKEHAAKNNISLSRFIEYLLRRAVSESYKDLEEFPVSAWVAQVAEGPVEYNLKKQSNRQRRKDYYESR